MANKFKITAAGHAIKGALAAHIAPRLAADKAIKPGELTALMQSIQPGTYVEQVPLIADAAQKAFKNRLAADADLDDLPEILEALREAAESEEDDEDLEDKAKDTEKPKDPKDAETPKGATDEDDDMGVDAEPGIELMKMLGEYEIPTEDLEKINTLITALSKGSGGPVKDKQGKDEFPEKGKPAEKDPEAVTKPAMDAALAEHGKNVRAQLAELYSAAEEVKPFIGQVDTLAFDSAADIYKLALDAAEVDTKNVHPSAFKSMLKLVGTRQVTQAQPMVAADAAAAEAFEKMYSHIPAQA